MSAGKNFTYDAYKRKCHRIASHALNGEVLLSLAEDIDGDADYSDGFVHKFHNGNWFRFQVNRKGKMYLYFLASYKGYGCGVYHKLKTFYYGEGLEAMEWIGNTFRSKGEQRENNRPVCSACTGGDTMLRIAYNGGVYPG